MSCIYFSQLPQNVARSAFRDTINKYVLQNTSGGLDRAQPALILAIPDRPTADFKHYGEGTIEFEDDTIAQEFMSKVSQFTSDSNFRSHIGYMMQLKTEPIMFEAEKVVFSREPPSISQSSRAPGAQTHANHEREREPRNKKPVSPPATVDNVSTISYGHKMNLSKPTRQLQPEKKGPRPENPRFERKLQHRLSALGQRARLETLEFGVLRNQNFSVEYSRNLLDEGGDFSFEDDEKSLRISIGGSHKDPSMPSIAIAIQIVNKVALGYDFGVPYMFLELLQNPHFELGNVARRLTGNAKDDVHHSRTRHSALDPKHRRIAPFASRWLKISFHKEGFIPDAGLCQLAGLPIPDTDPKLTFEKRDMYSLRKVEALEKWLRGNSLPWEVAFQCEALYRNGILVPQELLELRPLVEDLARSSATRARDVLKTFVGEFQGARARKTFNDFDHNNVVDAFKKHMNNDAKTTPVNRLQAGSSKSNFMCHHVNITPTAIYLTGMFVHRQSLSISPYRCQAHWRNSQIA